MELTLEKYAGVKTFVVSAKPEPYGEPGYIPVTDKLPVVGVDLSVTVQVFVFDIAGLYLPVLRRKTIFGSNITVPVFIIFESE